jgi:hypothetical protein
LIQFQIDSDDLRTGIDLANRHVQVWFMLTNEANVEHTLAMHSRD